LGRKETSQSAHTLDLAHLVGDALFELPIKFNKLLRLHLQLTGLLLDQTVGPLKLEIFFAQLAM
jgi:hypothetical protein